MIEIGAYPGRYLSIFGDMGYELNGIDQTDLINKLGIWLDQRGYRTGAFKKKDFTKYAKYKKYDLVVSFGFIEHFSNWKNIIEKHMDLVKSDGYLIITTPNFSGVIQYLLHYFLDRQNLRRHNISSMKIGKWKKILNENHYRIIKCEAFGNFDFWVDIENRNIFKRTIVSFIMQIKYLFTNIPNSSIYSPYLGLIAKKI